jgi:hypothetical protein
VSTSHPSGFVSDRKSAKFSLNTSISAHGHNVSLGYAVEYLKSLGVDIRHVGKLEEDSGTGTVLCVGDDDESTVQKLLDQYRTVVTVSDFQLGQRGNGEMAGAASGLNWVIGNPEGKPGSLPSGIAEQWCGALGATLALIWDRAPSRGGGGRSVRVDVSAADVLKSFVDQNAGNSMEVPIGWRRNGRVAVEHGGVFPQGFFPCKDGYVAIVARSRPDWQAVLQALGSPEWAQDGRFNDPIGLSRDDSVVRPLLEETTSKFSRQELLNLALKGGATMGPVLQPGEAAEWAVVPPQSGVSTRELPFFTSPAKPENEHSSDPMAYGANGAVR